jgi:hypothetical protein
MADEPCGFLEGHLKIVSPKPVEVAEPTAAQAVKSPVRLVEILFTGARFTNIQNDSAARKDVAAQIAERLLLKGRQFCRSRGAETYEHQDHPVVFHNCADAVGSFDPAGR